MNVNEKRRKVAEYNCEQYGLMVGRKTKYGNVIFQAGFRYFGISEEEDLEEFKKKIEKNKNHLRDFYVGAYIKKDGEIVDFKEKLTSPRKSEKEFYSVSTILSRGWEFFKKKGITKIFITKKPKKIGHLRLEGYEADLNGQKKLIEDLVELEDKKLYGEIEFSSYDLPGICFKQGWHKDYYLIRGSTCVQEPSDCEYFNGRIYYTTNSLLEEFWDNGIEDLKEYFDEIDPDADISVYTRKGKDWYVCPSLEEEGIEIAYLDDEECDEDWEYESITFLTFKLNKKTPKKGTKIIKILNALKDAKESMEVKGYIERALDLCDNCTLCVESMEVKGYIERALDFCDNYTLCVGDSKYILSLFFQDISYELASRIKEAWWKLGKMQKGESYDQRFKMAINKFIKKRYKILDDKTIVIKYEHSDGKISEKSYPHLKKIKKMAEKIGGELTYSKIPGTDIYQFAIRLNNEEYHFDIFQVIVNDIKGTESVSDFVRTAVDKLKYRIMKKINEEKLKEKSKYVFVGIQDSLNSGNCTTGTKEFLSKHNIDANKIGGIRGDILLELSDSSEKTFVKRAILEAIHRTGLEAPNV